MQALRNRLRFTSTWAMLGLAVLSLPLLTNAQTRYRVTGLGSLGTDSKGQGYSGANAINNAGDVAGWSGVYDASYNPLGMATFLWHNGTMTNLGNFGTESHGIHESEAYAINNTGDVVGYSRVYDATHTYKGYAAFLYHNGAMAKLGNFGTLSDSSSYSYALAINDAGDIVGNSAVSDASHNSLGTAAALWHNGTMSNLGNLGTDSNGVFNSFANAINNADDIVGWSNLFDVSHNSLGEVASIFSNSVITQLMGSLGTDSNGLFTSHANAINTAGDVAGWAYVYDASHNILGAAAFVWHNGTMTNLGNLGTDSNGGGGSYANAINSLGDVVGWANYFVVSPIAPRQDAFVYHNGQMLDLNSLIPAEAGWVLNEAKGINDKGQICGNGLHNNHDEAFLLDPIVPGDFDGDGHADLVWQNPANGQTGTWLMNNQTYMGNLGAGLPAPSKEWHVVGTPDYHADGNPGLLWQNGKTGDVGYWRLDKGYVQDAGLLASGVSTDWHIVSTVDINADGHADFVWWNSKTGQAAVWYMNGTTVQNTALLASDITGWTLAGAMPHTSDSSVTLLWRNNTSGDLAYWTLKNTALQASGMIASGVPQAWQVAGAVDMDGDGQPDILWQNTTTGEAAVWYMNGTTFKSGSTIAGTNGTSWKLIGAR